ncbi:hypothetical protein [Actinacidiphila glaucinigra]|uniref:hypothetical protein n=1 Tax=Actinacidiphila glaucinigra TaxID=235986 RepID=UPI00366C2DB8
MSTSAGEPDTDHGGQGDDEPEPAPDGSEDGEPEPDGGGGSDGGPPGSGLSGVWITVIGGIVATLLGVFVQWLLTDDHRPPDKSGPSIQTPDAGDGRGSGGQGGGGGTSGGNKTVSGKWFGKRGSLTVTVTKVENEGGHIRLYVRADNGYSEEVRIPLFMHFIANDDTGHSYTNAMPSDWAETVPAGDFYSGVIELEGFVEPNARSLTTVSFNQLYGPMSLTASGGVKIHDVPLPR